MSSPLPTSARLLLARTLRRRRRAVLAASALLILWQLCETLVPVAIGLVIDRAIAPSDSGALVVAVVGLVVLFTLLANGYRFAARIEFRAVQDEMHDLRLEIAGRVLSPRGARTGRAPGEVLTLATGDTEYVGQGLRVVAHTIAALAALVVSAWLLLSVDLTLGAVVLLGVPTVLLASQLLAPRIARQTETQQAAIGRATGVAADLVRGLRPLKGVGGEGAALDRYAGTSAAARDASIRSATSTGLQHGLAAALNGIFLAVVVLVAGRLASRGEITVGELVTVVGLAQMLGDPIEALAEVGAVYASAWGGAGRIAEHLDVPPLVADGPRRPDPGAPQPALLDVADDVLAGLTLRTAPGELVGVVAADPAVADRLVDLLAGEVRPERGALSLGGVPYDELAVQALRAHLVVSRHHVDVLEGTLASNIGAPTLAIRDAAVGAAALEDVVTSAAEGAERPTTSGGGTLSGGQRQRLALARVLAADPGVLVLHDPTTAVDAVTQERIAAALVGYRHGPGSDRTTLVLTSSPALLARAHRVLLVHRGVVVAEGTHAELVKHPDYARAVLR